MKRIVRKTVVIILIMLAVLFIITEVFISHYLNMFGYGINELSGTTLVCFRISKGYTVSASDNNDSSFIGRPSAEYYTHLFEEKGYYEYKGSAVPGAYRKKGREYKSDDEYEFTFIPADDYCHWFRIYDLSNGYKIEDILEEKQ